MQLLDYHYNKVKQQRRLLFINTPCFYVSQLFGGIGHASGSALQALSQFVSDLPTLLSDYPSAAAHLRNSLGVYTSSSPLSRMITDSLYLACDGFNTMVSRPSSTSLDNPVW